MGACKRYSKREPTILPNKPRRAHVIIPRLRIMKPVSVVINPVQGSDCIRKGWILNMMLRFYCTMHVSWKQKRKKQSTARNFPGGPKKTILRLIARNYYFSQARNDKFMHTAACSQTCADILWNTHEILVFIFQIARVSRMYFSTI